MVHAERRARRRPRRRPLRLPAHLGPRRPGRQRLRPPGRRRRHQGRPGHADRRQRRGLRRRRRCPPRSRQLLHGEDLRPGQRPVLPRRPAHRRQATRHHPARGPELHRRRLPPRHGRSGTCGSASPPARAWSCTGSATTAARIIHRASLSRDVRPLRRPGPDALPQAGPRRGRVRHRPAHQLPGTRLRLPRRDRLPGRRGQRQRRQGRHHAERHLPARRGPRHRLEAHRLPHRLRRSPPDAADGRLTASSPSATTSTPTTGTSTRTARSSTRSSSPA